MFFVIILSPLLVSRTFGMKGLTAPESHGSQFLQLNEIHGPGERRMEMDFRCPKDTMNQRADELLTQRSGLGWRVYHFTRSLLMKKSQRRLFTFSPDTQSTLAALLLLTGGFTMVAVLIYFLATADERISAVVVTSEVIGRLQSGRVLGRLIHRE